MQQYHDLLQNILTNGVRQRNRTGVDTFFLPNQTLKFDLADGFPAITTKKLAFKAMKGELLGMFRGYQSAADFRSIDCKVWDGNANKTPSWLANPNRKGEDDMGRTYPAQWTEWRDWREAKSAAEMEQMVASGYEVRAYDPEKSIWVMRKGINQLESNLRTLMTNPTDRRMLVTGWRPDEDDAMCLQVCHVLYNLICDVENKELHLSVTMRSWDSFLAFNIPLSALYLSIFAKLAGYTPRTVALHVANAHIYENHIEQVKVLLSRDHYAHPTLKLGDSIPTLTDVSQIPGVFARIQPDDITLEGYVSHPAIAAPMAA